MSEIAGLQQLPLEIVLYLPVATLLMSIVPVVLIGFLTVVVYGLPFLLVWLWIRKLSNFGNHDVVTWRSISLWVGLSFCTVAVVAFWLGIFTNPHSYPLEGMHFQRFFRFDEVAATLGIGAALAGKGKGRWWVVLSGVGTGANWLWFAVLQ